MSAFISKFIIALTHIFYWLTASNYLYSFVWKTNVILSKMLIGSQYYFCIKKLHMYMAESF